MQYTNYLLKASAVRKLRDTQIYTCVQRQRFDKYPMYIRFIINVNWCIYILSVKIHKELQMVVTFLNEYEVIALHLIKK